MCKSKINGRNFGAAINQHALSLVNYYIGILNIEPKKYKEFDESVRIILIKHHVHQQPACKKRLYLPRKGMGRGITIIEFKSERMLLQLWQTLKSSKETSLRRRAILYTENKSNAHLSLISSFLKSKYRTAATLSTDELTVIQSKALYNIIFKKFNHAKLYRLTQDPNASMEELSRWLTHGNISPEKKPHFVHCKI